MRNKRTKRGTYHGTYSFNLLIHPGTGYLAGQTGPAGRFLIGQATTTEVTIMPVIIALYAAVLAVAIWQDAQETASES